MTILFRSKSTVLHQHKPPRNTLDYNHNDNEDDEPFKNNTPIVMYNNTIKDKNRNSEMIDYMVETLRKSLLVTCYNNNNNNVEKREELSRFDISCPTHVRHISHVTFDCFNGFLGLPDELLPQLPSKVPSASASVFGVSPQSMQCCIDERGNSVPTLLVMLQKRLYVQGGLQAEGIFRINAENSQEECVRSQLNKGVVPRDIDVHCVAGLIKAWFRELPKGVLDSLTPEQVMHCNTEDQCTELVKLLSPTETDLLGWAINLMADVVQNEHYNKMNARNIAMVFAPNMTQMADPLTALIHAVQVMNLLKTLIERTLQLRQDFSKTTTTISSNSVLQNNSHNPRSSTTFGELISQEQKNSCALEQPHSNKLI